MRTLAILASLTFLAACTQGRWTVRDLSSFSFQFDPPAPARPFAKARPIALPLSAAVRPMRAPARSVAAATH